MAGEKVSASVKVSAGANGAQRLTYKVGPFHVIPGQNDISYKAITQKPKVDGWITRIRPDLIYTTGRSRRVDVIHLHHGVWLNLSRSDATAPGLPERFFAAGEEKTVMRFPKGYGYEYKASDTWLLNHMIHNLTPVPAEVWMVYEIDFIPKTSPRRAASSRSRPIWMDVENGSLYPVFNVEKGAGQKGVFTLPERPARRLRQRPQAERVDLRPQRRAGGHGRPSASRRPAHRPLGAAPRASAYPSPPARARSRRVRASAAARRPRAGAATTPTCSGPTPSTSSRPVRCRGTWQ